ncbi:MAG TPA: hypothetical protein VFT39_18035 [Vicinamibacterales bacterium]|nr:hypothetical protein [Vicinamibacterales bacterium]
MSRRVSVLTSAAAAIAIAASISCSRNADNEPPVATPSLTLSRDKVAIGSPVKLTYKFVVAPDAKFNTDYWVFVHVLDPTGELLWTDDHLPNPSTSTWKPGQTVEYTRTVFVPNYPYIGEALVRLGLYDRASSNRLALNAQQVSRREYLVAKFQLQPQSENIFLIYKDGWHPAEVATDNAASEWQWTKKTATISFKNPKKDSTFYLDFDARTDLFTPPQKVTLKIGDQTMTTFAADNRERKLLTFPITAAQLGNGDMTELVIDTDRTFSPGSGDVRELGIRVFHAFIEPK